MVQKAQSPNLGPYKANTYVVGDVMELLRQLPDDSIDCVVTSPPYYGLRDYGIEPSVWGGRADCEHRWGDEMVIHKGGFHGNGVLLGGGRAVVDAQAAVRDIRAGQFCQDCGAWRGCLGLEPTLWLYIDHMVDVFREVRRVLKPAGTLWLNLGDSYATCAYAVGYHPGGGEQGRRWRGGRGDRLGNGRGDQSAEHRSKKIGPLTQPNRMPQPGLKPKDLMLAPHRVAIALQEDGWLVRQDNVWHKTTAMPESVGDRTTRAHEYLFQLAKSPDYYYDADAIKEPVTGAAHPRGEGVNPKAGPKDESRDKQGLRPSTRFGRGAGFRVKQNASFGKSVAELVSSRNKRSVWPIAGEPTKDAHFATMPTKLVQPCVLAGCPAGGVVLDPFGGSGTTGKVAEGNGRRWLLFDRSPEYAEIAKRRTAQVGLLGRCANEP